MAGEYLGYREAEVRGQRPDPERKNEKAGSAMRRRPRSSELNRLLRWLIICVIIGSALGFQSRFIVGSRPPSSDPSMVAPAAFLGPRFVVQRQVVPHRATVLLLASREDSKGITVLAEVEDDDSSTSEESSSFLLNIKSKLTFPLYDTTPRKTALSSGRLASIFQKIKRFVLFPYRWVRKRLRRDDVEEGPAQDLSGGEATELSLVTEVPGDKVEVVVGVGEPVVPAKAARKPKTSTRLNVQGDRWAISSVDLSGKWELEVTEDFKKQYDSYLTLLGQPMLVRSVALSIVGLTTEETIQKDKGRELFIQGRNVRGVWERSLLASGADAKSPDFEPILTPIVTADSEQVTSEAWWEDDGTVHRSWLRGVQKYGGGDFESRRYLDGKLLVCESTFHPLDETRKKASVTWYFKPQRS